MQGSAATWKAHPLRTGPPVHPRRQLTCAAGSPAQPGAPPAAAARERAPTTPVRRELRRHARPHPPSRRTASDGPGTTQAHLPPPLCAGTRQLPLPGRDVARTPARGARPPGVRVPPAGGQPRGRRPPVGHLGPLRCWARARTAREDVAATPPPAGANARRPPPPGRAPAALSPRPAGQSTDQGRSFSGFRMDQTLRIRSPTTSNAITAAVLPSYSRSTPGWPFTVRSRTRRRGARIRRSTR